MYQGLIIINYNIFLPTLQDKKLQKSAKINNQNLPKTRTNKIRREAKRRKIENKVKKKKKISKVKNRNKNSRDHKKNGKTKKKQTKKKYKIQKKTKKGIKNKKGSRQKELGPEDPFRSSWPWLVGFLLCLFFVISFFVFRVLCFEQRSCSFYSLCICIGTSTGNSNRVYANV